MTSPLTSDLQASLGSAYTLERELGGGGMSRLFIAEEVAFGRKVAVKVLAPELAAGVSAERFQREIKLAAQLQHPNIVPVHTTGIAAGLPYYTMPFVDGLSLRARLDRNPAIPITEGVAILKDLARALAYAHDHGIVHRDIKPENILLADEASVVTDFGIAKALHASRTNAPGGTLTQVGTSLGTPAYMAPEQAAGDPATDHRADIYSFGCVGYEVLTGAAPFAGRPPHQLFAAHMSEMPTPISTRRADCPKEIADLVMQCLEKDPAKRPQTARELLRALDATSTRTRETVHPTAVSPKARNLVIAAAALIAVIAAGATYALKRGGGGADIRSLAVLPFQNVGGDTANAYFAEGMADELTTELSKVAGLTLASRSSAFRFRGENVDVRSVGRELGVGAVLEGTVRRAGDRLRLTAQLSNAATGKLLWTDSYEQQVKDVFAVQDSVTRAIVSALKVRLAGDTAAASTAIASSPQGTRNLEAYDLYLRGRYLWAHRGEESLRKAIALFKQAIDKDPQFARTYAGLAMAYSVLPMYAYVASDSVIPSGLAAGQRGITLDPNLSDAHLAYANNLIYGYKWDEAEEHFKRAIALDPRNPTAHQWYGDYLYVTGRVGDAIPELRRATELDPLSAVLQNDLGFALRYSGQYAEATKVLSRSLELDPEFVWGRGNLGGALLGLGETDSAIAAVEPIAGAAGDAPAVLIKAYLLQNRRADAELVLDGVRKHSMRFKEGGALALAFAHGTIGNADSALYWLAKAINDHEGGIFSATVPCDDAFEGIRSDPRFNALLKRMGAQACQRQATSRSR